MFRGDATVKRIAVVPGLVQQTDNRNEKERETKRKREREKAAPVRIMRV